MKTYDATSTISAIDRLLTDYGQTSEQIAAEQRANFKIELPKLEPFLSYLIQRAVREGKFEMSVNSTSVSGYKPKTLKVEASNARKIFKILDESNRNDGTQLIDAFREWVAEVYQGRVEV